jgi:UDP-N-acetyl-D-glucosamine dehydrogenase
MDVVFICVPTPYTEAKAPDISFIRQAAQGIARYLHRDQLIILQSTTYPGTTEEEVQPILESTGLRAGVDFYLAFSPERVDPGNTQYTVENTPKVVGGVTRRCGELTALLLGQLAAPVVTVSSPRVAEMTKLLENTFRAVNIALVNELALLCERMGIDVWEVIGAAATKPFGFMPFTPGPGVGGHCIPVDPHYLAWKAREYDFSSRFIELAAAVNEAMPFHVVDLVVSALNRQGRPLRGAKVLILGVAFKRDIDDARNSPAKRVMELLLKEGAQVIYHDPYVPRFSLGGDALHQPNTTLTSVPLHDSLLGQCDVAVIVTGHRCVDYTRIVAACPLVVDTVNATRGMHAPSIVRLGAPH